MSVKGRFVMVHRSGQFNPAGGKEILTNELRRRVLKSMAFTAAAFSMPGLLAEELMRTVRQAEGPFYPD